MDDFRKFMQSGGSKPDDGQARQQGSSQTNPFNSDGSRKSQMEYIQDLARYYNDHGEEKLIADIFRNVSQQKADGKISNEEITRMSRTIGAMLNPTQKAKLDGLVKELTK